MSENDTAGRLSGLRAWVTGGSSGIGAGIVRILSGEGADVAVLDLQGPDDGRDWARCDISDPDSVRAATAELLERGGVPDILVNNAGITANGNIVDLTDDEWQRAIGINLSGAFYVTRAVLQGMIDRGSGRIITTSSISAVLVGPGRSAYSTSKAGLLGLSRAIAAEGAPHGVTSNVIAPGVTATPMTLAAYGDRATMEYWATKSVVSNPMGVVLEPEDLANAVLFFSLPASSHITGQVLHVSAGAWMP
jgi:NAD(P)-dependent dehydrogenase (short-subunit alcohol dehydrogenase family)